MTSNKSEFLKKILIQFSVAGVTSHYLVSYLKAFI